MLDADVTALATVIIGRLVARGMGQFHDRDDYLVEVRRVFIQTRSRPRSSNLVGEIDQYDPWYLPATVQGGVPVLLSSDFL